MLLDGNDRERAFSSANTGLQGCGPWETLVAVHDQVCASYLDNKVICLNQTHV
jgi:hypothetical protein